MALSHHEQRTLEQIAAELDAESHWVAWQVGGRPRRSVRHHVVAAALLLLAITAMTCAVLIPHRGSVAGPLTVAVAAYLVMGAGLRLWVSDVGR
jgi:hypothetical protein